MSKELLYVKEYIKTLPIRLNIMEFDEGSTKTSQMAAEQLGVEVGQIAKSILFTTENGPILVVTSGDVKVSTSKLKKVLGVKPKMASYDECELVTGFKPGGICPFALKNEVTIFIDKSLDRFDLVYAAAGTANTAVPITLEELLIVTDGSLVDLA